MPTSNKNSLLKQSKKREKQQKTIIDMDNRSLEQSKGQSRRLTGREKGKGEGDICNMLFQLLHAIMKTTQWKGFFPPGCTG